MQLIDALDDERLSIVTGVIHELTALSALGAIPHLRRLERSHWYGPVRKRAGAAAEALERSQRERRPVEISTTGNDWCSSTRAPVVEVNGVRFAVEPKNRAQERPSGFPAVDLAAVRGAWAKDLRCDHTYERVARGWLVTTDCGEWGGGLAFVGDQGDIDHVTDEDAHEFVRIGEKLLLIGGSHHLGILNHGHVLELYEEGTRWRARWFAEPVGYVYRTQIVPEGLVLVSIWGASVLRPDGAQFEIPCMPRE